MAFSEYAEDSEVLDQIRCNLIDVETEQQKTNELLKKSLGQRTWDYLHMWRESEGVYRAAFKGEKGSSIEIKAPGHIAVLNILGGEAWELVGMLDDSKAGFVDFIFKRPRLED